MLDPEQHIRRSHLAMRYLDVHDDPVDAAAALAQDLMRGNPAQHQAGYSFTNALLVAGEIFELNLYRHVQVSHKLAKNLTGQEIP